MALGGWEMIIQSRRELLHAAAAAGFCSLPAITKAEETYPSRPIRLVLGYPAGNAPDIIARLIGQAAAEELGGQIVIENRPGASGNIATEIVVRAPADGYTLLMITTAHAINVTLYKNAKFNFMRDIVPIASIGRNAFVMVVYPEIPAKTVPEFIAYAKKNPGKINFASPGVASSPHLLGELFAMKAGIELVHVPYRGSFMPDLIGGQVQVVFSPVPLAMEYIRTGKLRALAVTTTARLDALPEIAAMSEFVPGYEAVGLYGLGAPRNTPATVIDKLNEHVGRIIAAQNVKNRLLALGVEPVAMSPTAFRDLIAAETQKWANVIQFAHVQAD
jgi:tripartite-type tricarboxylate transporter receptor subunit TctC